MNCRHSAAGMLQAAQLSLWHLLYTPWTQLTSRDPHSRCAAQPFLLLVLGLHCKRGQVIDAGKEVLLHGSQGCDLQTCMTAKPRVSDTPEHFGSFGDSHYCCCWLCSCVHKHDSILRFAGVCISLDQHLSSSARHVLVSFPLVDKDTYDIRGTSHTNMQEIQAWFSI
jgi:hypothetical protein